MADRMLFIGWGAVARGSEERAVEVFNEALGLLGRREQEGRIEGFDVHLMEPNSDLGGYIEIHGTAEQLMLLRGDEEFRRNMVDSALIVDGLRHIEGFSNEGVAREMALFTDAAARVPQRA
jgi:hypothetical protein